MTNKRSLLLPLALLLSTLGGCTDKTLQGNWVVDFDSTIQRAKADGIPESFAPQIRETFDGGRLEITADSLIMRIAGSSDAITSNYTLTGKEGDCYTLAVSQSSAIHKFCIEADHLVAHDSSTKISVVYRRE